MLAAEAGTQNVVFHENSFSDLNDNMVLPKSFDMITLHGVWSWIGSENRHHIIKFVLNRLKPGGLLYISYNALPGWAAIAPLRRLFVDQSLQVGGPLPPRIEQALAFAKRLVDADPAYVRANPGIKARLDTIQGQDRRYLAHEYFNRDWTPFYHADVAADLVEAKLSYLGSAHLLDHLDAVNLTPVQQSLLAEIGDISLRETVRDYIVNQQFRRDVFIKGHVPLTSHESRERWMAMRFALSTRRSDVPLKVTGLLGEANLQADVYEPVLDLLADGPRSVSELMTNVAVARVGWSRLTQALLVLVASGHLQPALSCVGEAERTSRARAFNTAVLNRAKSSADLRFLASPITGAGVAVDRFQQLFLLAQQNGYSEPVTYAWNILQAADQRLTKDGRLLESPEENLDELRAQHGIFVAERLPVLQQLSIA